MKLQDIYDQLANGELSQLYEGQHRDENGCIPEESLRKLWPNINLGLTELHKRFLIREGTVVLGLIEGRYSYVIDVRYAQSNDASKELTKYIQDIEDPFQDDLLKIERVYDAAGKELALNVVDDLDAIRTPTLKSLIVPESVQGDTLKVVYRANHPMVNTYLASSAPTAVDIELPASHLEPLFLYVASRMLNPVGFSGEFHEGNNYSAKFEASVARLQQLNFRVDTDGANNRLVRNGWV